MAETIRTGEFEMRYIKCGEGKRPLVILPGLSLISVIGSEDAIISAYDIFAKDFTVYLFDRVSSMPDDYSVEDAADDTAKAIGLLGIDKVALMGVSMGGMIAQYIAIKHSVLVDKLVLCSTCAKTGNYTRNLMKDFNELSKTKNGHALSERFSSLIYSEQTMKAYGDMLIGSGDGAADEDFRRFSVQTAACFKFDVTRLLSRISCPVLVLGAKNDRIIPVGDLLYVADTLSCERYVYGPPYGHAVYDEAPDFKQRIYDFLKK
ncbi:MAG: alpha/beta hydrolase [Clostridia bacterium]|nr:alpha/beta hydrolase [Clostridia bacterium]